MKNKLKSVKILFIKFLNNALYNYKIFNIKFVYHINNNAYIIKKNSNLLNRFELFYLI